MIATVVVSITSWMVIAHVLLTFQWWHPRPVGGVVLGVACLAACNRRPAGRSRHHVSPRQLRTIVDELGWFQIIGSLTTLALWVASLASIDTSGFGDWGLIAAVPPTFSPHVARDHRCGRCRARTRHEAAPGRGRRSRRF